MGLRFFTCWPCLPVLKHHSVAWADCDRHCGSLGSRDRLSLESAWRTGFLFGLPANRECVPNTSHHAVTGAAPAFSRCRCTVNRRRTCGAIGALVAVPTAVLCSVLIDEYLVRDSK